MLYSTNYTEVTINIFLTIKKKVLKPNNNLLANKFCLITYSCNYKKKHVSIILWGTGRKCIYDQCRMFGQETNLIPLPILILPLPWSIKYFVWQRGNHFSR